MRRCVAGLSAVDGRAQAQHQRMIEEEEAREAAREAARKQEREQGQGVGSTGESAGAPPPQPALSPQDAVLRAADEATRAFRERALGPVEGAARRSPPGSPNATAAGAAGAAGVPGKIQLEQWHGPDAPGELTPEEEAAWRERAPPPRPLHAPAPPRRPRAL
jgi:hypothetical protein